MVSRQHTLLVMIAKLSCQALMVSPYFRSYGVLLWEIVMYGETPLSDRSNAEVVDLAERGKIKHIR